jgi:hypothetical protein
VPRRRENTIDAALPTLPLGNFRSLRDRQKKSARLKTAGRQMRRYARWKPGGDTGIQRKRGPFASGGQCKRAQSLSEMTICMKDTVFNYFLLKTILEDFFLVRSIFAIFGQTESAA